jgi:uncharacterized protein YqeY
MSLREKIKDLMKEAMKSGQQKSVSTYRMVMAALKDRDIDARTRSMPDGIPDEEILQMLQSMIKQRRDSIDMYKKGGREDLATQEQDEINLIEDLLPAQMDEAQIQITAAAVISDIGAAGMKDMGKVMAVLKERHPGEMDFGKASQIIKTLLAG